jgi:dihydrofolate synthase / folylpolyglutamate synthase
VNLAGEISAIAAEYPGRGRRQSLAAVAELRRRLPVEGERVPAIGVVGTNGKTSTATYLARLLSAAGVRTGLYTSPHLTSWTERVRIDGAPCDPRALGEALARVNELARGAGGREDLRFFDLLTLAAEALFGRAGVSVAVYEAGIGGRLDAIRLLEPRLVLMTNVAVDHAEILGAEPSQILREKLLVAPRGAVVAAFPLGDGLDALAERIAAEHGFRVRWLRDDPEGARRHPAGPAFLDRALALARAGRRLAAELAIPGARLDDAATAEIDLRVPGRGERGRRDGVPYLLDSAHNEAGWRQLREELDRRPLRPGGPQRLLAVVSLSPDKPRRALAEALRSLPGLEGVIATRHSELAAVDPGALAAELRGHGLEVAVEEAPGLAIERAFERARALEAGVVVFGSTHLAADALRLLPGPGVASAAQSAAQE